jgi:hypothetical protein
VWARSGDRIPLAIGVLQVLALDIGTDILPAVLVADTVQKAFVRRGRGWKSTARTSNP